MNKPGTLRVGVAGLGTVGSGVCNILLGKAELLAKRAGRGLALVAVSARDANKARNVNIGHARFITDARALATDSEVDVVVEVIGGEDGVALDVCENALKNGKPVVTANKALLAKHGLHLSRLAEECRAAIYFEAAVAGGIPIIKTLKEALAGNTITRISGILNGTCNYILTQMKYNDTPFDAVLAEAQRLGYAETPPDLDIDGHDTAHKLAILTAIAFGSNITMQHMHVEGIRNVTLQDIAYAEEFGYTIRLLGIANTVSDAVEQRVYPALVSHGSPLAAVDGVLNAVLTECDAAGPLFLCGAGAGAGPTASSVISDLVDIAAGRRSPTFGIPTAAQKDRKFIGMDTHTGEYYVRLKVKDTSGVLAQLTATLSAQNISMENIRQIPVEKGTSAQIAFTTNIVAEKAVQAALAAISKADYILEPPHMIRIEG